NGCRSTLFHSGGCPMVFIADRKPSKDSQGVLSDQVACARKFIGVNIRSSVVFSASLGVPASGQALMRAPRIASVPLVTSDSKNCLGVHLLLYNDSTSTP